MVMGREQKDKMNKNYLEIGVVLRGLIMKCELECAVRNSGRREKRLPLSHFCIYNIGRNNFYLMNAIHRLVNPAFLAQGWKYQIKMPFLAFEFEVARETSCGGVGT